MVKIILDLNRVKTEQPHGRAVYLALKLPTHSFRLAKTFLLKQKKAITDKDATALWRDLLSILSKANLPIYSCASFRTPTTLSLKS